MIKFQVHKERYPCLTLSHCYFKDGVGIHIYSLLCERKDGCHLIDILFKKIYKKHYN